MSSLPWVSNVCELRVFFTPLFRIILGELKLNDFFSVVFDVTLVLDVAEDGEPRSFCNMSLSLLGVTLSDGVLHVCVSVA